MKTQTKSEKKSITVKASERPILEEARERLAIAYAAITDRAAAIKSLESKENKLSAQIEKGGASVDPLNDSAVAEFAAKKVQLELVQSRLNDFNNDDSLETSCIEALRETGAVLRPIHSRKYEELVDKAVRLIKPLYRDEASAQYAAASSDLITAYQGAANFIWLLHAVPAQSPEALSWIDSLLAGQDPAEQAE